MLPRLFIASTTSMPGAATRDQPGAVEDVLATVSLGVTELVVAAGVGGRLLAVDAAARRSLGARAQAQLAFHEVASNRALALEAGELYLFDLQMVELLPDAPGLNDPLYLYGSLRGPYPASLDTETASVDGQLTVSRADLLAALIEGVETSFAYESSSRGSRCVHALLPGEPADAIARGRGLILAFPLAQTALLGGAANDLLVAQIFYDVLGAMRAELQAHPVERAPLPVPSRVALEESLAGDGWRIEGDTAVRPARGRGVVASLLGRDEERRHLPRQGTLAEYAVEARALLAQLGPPTPATVAIRRRDATRHQPTTPVASIATRAAVDVAPQAPVPLTLPRPRIETPRTEWIKDFVDAHRSPERPPPQVVRPARVLSREATPAWMGDFSQPAPDPRVDDGESERQPLPDWSKDFD